MDREFTTTFIPKKPLAQNASASKEKETRPRRESRAGILSMLGIFLFFLAIVASAGVYFYRGYVETRIDEKQLQIERAEASFEPSLIEEIQELDTRLIAAQGLLNRHIAVTPVFEVLAETTLPAISYQSFGYTNSPEGGDVTLTLTGEALGYTQIAQQSDIFGSHPLIKDHLFQGFQLTDDARVRYELSITFAASTTRYVDALRREQGVSLQETDIITPSTTVES